MRSILFTNANIVTPTGTAFGEMFVANGRIEKMAFGRSLSVSADRTVDVGGRYLSPGFIDIHTHGGGGADFMDGDVDAIYRACDSHLRHGTTAIVPTTITGDSESLFNFVDLFQKVELRRPGSAEILGIHLEGPYFSPAQSGAQDPRHMRAPRPAEYLEVLRRSDRVIRWSFAVELEGSMEFLRVLREHGVVSSLAHSDATCDEVFRAYNNGIACLTHFYSGMAGVRRINAFRVGGAIEAGYLLDDLYVEVIADGKHLPSELLRLIHKVKGSERICLVSDSMRAAGMPDGTYKLGDRKTGLDVVVEDGVAKMPDRTAFAGSVATADRLVRTMRDLAGVPLHEAVRMMTLTPAQLLRIDGRKGSLAEGKDADILIFNDNVEIDLVITRGEIAPITEIPSDSGNKRD